MDSSETLKISVTDSFPKYPLSSWVWEGTAAGAGNLDYQGPPEGFKILPLSGSADPSGKAPRVQEPLRRGSGRCAVTSFPSPRAPRAVDPILLGIK